MFVDLLPSNDKGNTDTDTQTDGRNLWSKPLRWAQVPGFIQIGSGIQKLIGVIHSAPRHGGARP
jgi:hypothetical protein